VLFCDLLGSTAIAAQLDPEEWREIVAGYHRAASEAIIRFGGHVAKYLGDGVMAYFGYPEAHDNDAERAARAGLAILDALAKRNEDARGPNLSARVGIDSGPVVVGADGGRDADVFGDTPNIAARVQSVAEPDTVMITDATHRLVSGIFVVESHGAKPFKGVARPVEVYRVVRPTGVRGRLALARNLTRFVGREEELRLLQNRWEQTREGEGQTALVIGEAGIGKSRLVAEFHERIRDTPHIWMESAGEQFFENTPFHALTEMLSQWLALQGGVNPAEKLERLERAVASTGLKPGEAVPLVADLLQVPLNEQYSASTLTPEQRRQRLLAVLAEWVLGAARLQPVVMMVEDLHWLDPSTLELQQLLVDRAATAPVMLLYTARPEFRPPWPLRAHQTQINLNRLSARNVRSMVEEVSARKALSATTVTTVVERTEGVPLFVEELTRALLESGDTSSTGREIPVTLHDSLLARLDRLGPAKEILQIGAVIGSEFSYESLHAVHPITEQDLQTALHRATEAELVYVRGIPPDAIYQFKHALIRDAAYEALLKSRRKELHRQVAQTINERFPALKESHPEVLARHWSEAGETESAIAEWSKAGRIAEARNAFKEALESYQRALALLNLLPESHERDTRELALTQSLVSMLSVTRGYVALETVNATTRATALAEKSGNLKQLVNWVRSRGLTSMLRGDYRAAGEIADQALDLALREGSPTSIAGVHQFQSQLRLLRGDHLGCEEHFIAGFKFFDDPEFRQLPGLALVAFGAASWNAWTLGHPDLAHEREIQMMSVVNRNNPFDLAFSTFFVAVLRLYEREYGQAEEQASQALELSEKHQFKYQTALSQCVLGQARAHLGRAREGVKLICLGIAGLLECGNCSGLTRYTAFLAAAQELDGKVVEALETVERAILESSDELLNRPETLRLRGQLRLKLGQLEQAEAGFREAIDLARSMGARAWELRATMSLARLLASQSKPNEARAMLAEIYDWFTEGFDTADLKDAKALLDEL
jgi:class 3 adenylate cyclase/tetratricopeptide (TPR) repeat protein